VEEFSLGVDRERALAQLIPGTEDHYYFHCLQLQHLGRLGEVDALVATWIERHGSSGRVREICHRQALLRAGADPRPTFDYLKRELDLRFDHQREAEERQQTFPGKLDPELVSRARFLERELRELSDLNGFEERALDWLPGVELSPEKRRQLLQRLRRPDHPRLVELVLQDLGHRGSGGFGSLGIHALLTRAQLEALAKTRANLWQEPRFVHVYLAQMRPGPDVDLDHDLDAREAHLAALWAVVARLAPAFNSLKAHVLYHRLALERRRGRYPRELLLTYLALPRAAEHVAPELLERREHRGHPADLGQDFRALTGLAPVGTDQVLVDDYLTRCLLEDDSWERFGEWVSEDHLRELLATARLLAGRGDLEANTALLPDPARLEALKERVDLEFAPTNPAAFGAAEPVRLDVFVKNVETLVVKVFEVNAFAYHQAHGREVDASIDLDGLVASEEQTHTYQEPPLRRVKRTFEFPGLSRPGVFVVELIGNGRASRAMLRKGTLRAVERLSAAGHVFSVLDEEHRPLPDASLWLGGREYRPRPAEKPGELPVIVVPYSSAPGRVVALLRHGALCAAHAFEHRGEAYELSAGLYAERERLLKGREAEVVVRPRLTLHGLPISEALLEEPRLSIESEDANGKHATLDVPALELAPGRDLVHRFRTPERLRRIRFRFQAKVPSLTHAGKVELSDERSYELNGIDGTQRLYDAHLARTAAGHVLYVLGKTGEPRPGLLVNVAVKHRDFRREIHLTLQADARGRVELGGLEEIAWLQVSLPDGASQRFGLPGERLRLPAHVHVLRGEAVSLPYLGRRARVDAEGFALLERRGDTYLRDRLESLSLEQGQLVARGLEAGAYRLWLKEHDAVVEIQVVAGQAAAGWAISPTRMLELRRRPPLAAAEVRADDQAVAVRWVHAGPGTRVLAVATRFQPAHDLLGALAARPGPGPRSLPLERPPARYQSGRDIGDEYRYVLERRYARKYPGSMLERPWLLLNPWPVRKTTTGLAEAGGGEGYASESRPPPRPAAAPRPSVQPGQAAAAASACLDFLADPAAVFWELAPDAQGWVRVPREALRAHNSLRLLATDGEQALELAVPLPEAQAAPQDLRLQDGLDPQGHFGERKQVSLLQAGEALTVADVTTAELERFDSLARVFGLFQALSRDPHLDRFAFLLDWPGLPPEEQRRLLSEHACHELHFFLWRKDPAFFQAALAPYLAHKREQTFLDHYLLGRDLEGYLEPWAFGQLNAAERALLVRRVTRALPGGRRHLRGLTELIPRDPGQEDQLFEAALAGGKLAAGDELGMEQAKGRAVAKRRAKRDEAERSRAGVGGAMPTGLAMKSMAARPPPAPAPAAEMALDRCCDEEAEAPCEAECLEADLALRQEVQPLFQAVEKTEEWAENNYDRLPIEQQTAELIKPNRFWLDYVEHDGERPFLSRHLAEAVGSFPEMMLALAVLDLPLRAEAPEVTFEGEAMTIRCRAPAVVLHQAILPTEPAAESAGILASQHYFRADDRYTYEDGAQVEKYVTGELLVHTVYQGQAVVTNTTSSPQPLEVLLQLPRGALPLSDAAVTRGVRLRLEPYTTERLEYDFYFPAAGDFAHFPVHVSRQGALLAAAAPRTLHVVAAPSQEDQTAWAWVSQNASAEECLRYLEGANLARLELDKMAWRMRDKRFFLAALELLRERQHYHDVLWSYALKHGDAHAAGEYLRHQEGFLRESGLWLRSPLVDIEPVRRRWYQHLEYAPLVNARVHKLGARRKILNDRLAEQWQRFLEVLQYKPALDDEDWLEACYYLLLQERVEEALEAFGRVDRARVAEGLQWDYLAALVALLQEEPARARALAAPHRDHPVDRWRKRFQAVLAQLDERDGQATGVVDEDSRAERQDRLAAGEPAFDFQVENKVLTLHHQNLTRCRVNYYRMDIELRFSRQPFVQEGTGAFGFIRPNRSDELTLPSATGTFVLELPPELHAAHAVVEVVAAGVQKSQVHYAHALVVQVSENYGQLRVSHQGDGAACPKAYVKVYARMRGGAVTFYKDGYTDLRGRFDYASLSTDELDRVERFAILVLHETHGAVIREAAPPKR